MKPEAALDAMFEIAGMMREQFTDLAVLAADADSEWVDRQVEIARLEAVRLGDAIRITRNDRKAGQ